MWIHHKIFVDKITFSAALKKSVYDLYCKMLAFWCKMYISKNQSTKIKVLKDMKKGKN